MLEGRLSKQLDDTECVGNLTLSHKTSFHKIAVPEFSQPSYKFTKSRSDAYFFFFFIFHSRSSKSRAKKEKSKIDQESEEKGIPI